MTKKTAKYTDRAPGERCCADCSMFRKPSECTLVDGKISPEGWCRHWAKKTGISDYISGGPL